MADDYDNPEELTERMEKLIPPLMVRALNLFSRAGYGGKESVLTGTGDSPEDLVMKTITELLEKERRKLKDERWKFVLPDEQLLRLAMTIINPSC
jgi:hypothetical protein